MEFHRSITRRRALVGMNKSNSNTKSKSPLKGKPMGPRGANAIRVPKNELDTADFLIDGLTHHAPTALSVFDACISFS
jgi:hypothetical protein